jgi:hypothetical protein
MFKKIAIGIASLIALLLIVASFQPADFSISRAVTIDAPPAKIFGHINDVKLYQAWNPFAKMDPNMAMTYSGPSAGLGAAASWDSHANAGAGTMTVTTSEAPSHVIMRLDFTKPMTSTDQAEFTLQPLGKSTLVTWTMSGKNNLIAKTFHIFVNMDKMLGGYFEQGLASLKTIVETEK